MVPCRAVGCSGGFCIICDVFDAIADDCSALAFAFDNEPEDASAPAPAAAEDDDDDDPKCMPLNTDLANLVMIL